MCTLTVVSVVLLRPHHPSLSAQLDWTCALVSHQAVVWGEWGWVLVLWIGKCYRGGSLQCRSVSVLIVSRPAHVLTCTVWASLCVSGFPSWHTGSSGWASIHVDFSSLQIPSSGASPSLMLLFFPLSYLIMWRSFLQVWLYRRSSASF